MTGTTRKLATIVALDVAGYSARTEADEARTTAEVAALRKVIEGIAAKRGGRVFNTAGDGFMLEFGSSLAAVEAAFELAETCEPKVRVGVHLGDVVVQPNGDLLGHGVNVAARLMAKSDPGGALVSAAVRQTIRGPVVERLISRGLMQLDKMAETIEAFALAAATTASAPVAPNSIETLLAVLPFENLSSDSEMQFFSDGVSEDILGRIQRGSKLKVVGRTSSFQFRGLDKPRAAATLKATHVLDGSVRRGGSRVRIAAHLTEAASQTMLWSDKYDRSLDDVFAVQDEISEAIATALDAAFSDRKIQKVDAALYDLFLQARAPTDNPLYRSAEAVATMQTITRLAPDFAPAWGTLALMQALRSLRLPFSERAAQRATIEAAIAKCRMGEPHNTDALAASLLVTDPFGAFLAQAAVTEQFKENMASDSVILLIPGFLESVGRGRDAVAACRRLLKLDALNSLGVSMLGLVQWRAGDVAGGKAAMLETLEKWPATNDAAVLLMIAAVIESDWALVDRLSDPARLARYPLGEFAGILNFAETARHPTAESRKGWIDRLSRFVDKTGHLPDPFAVALTAWFGFTDVVFALIERAKLGPTGGDRDQLGYLAFRPNAYFINVLPELRRDPRFVKLCARLGLVEYWLATQQWPDCVPEVAPYYDFKAECERYRNHPKDKFFG